MAITDFYVNSVDPDQMPHSVASDLGLHCLPMSLLWDTRLKWVKTSLTSKVSNLHLMIANDFSVRRRAIH